MTPVQYLELQLDTLFLRDAAGRLLAINERSNVNVVPPAPRVFFGRTPAGNVVTCHADLPDDLRRRAEALLRAEPGLPDLPEPPRCRAELYALLAQQAPVQQEYAGPAYHFPDAIAETAAPTVAITAANGGLLQAHFPDVLADLETSRPCMAVLEDGAAVSVCFSARITQRAAEAGVHTAPFARRRGYAAAATAAWALAIRARGAIPLYSTSWENHASQAVAHRLGLVCYGADWYLT